MGTLRIKGTIDINQFWPLGASDADTTKIKLQVHTNSFSYKADNGSRFNPTTAFAEATSSGKISTPVIKKSKRTGIQTITVRLQGLDAPELHYRAAPLRRTNDITEAERNKFNSLNEERRQCYAESSTVALTKFLNAFANSQGNIAAIFETLVDFPADAVDTYGRFVGNITVDNHDVNSWIVENGWGQPGFYTSMTKTEIETFLTAFEKSKSKRNRPSSTLSRDASDFNWELVYRRPPINNQFTIGDDKGRVIMPKIFRRQVSWMVQKKAGVVSQNTPFRSFLKQSPDQLVLLNDFLENGVNSSTVLSLADFISDQNKIIKNPEELVFKEKPSTLLNKRRKKIVKW